MNGYIFFVGPRKTGTTSFYEVLKQANATVSPKVKESFFFDQASPEIQDYQPRYSLDPSAPFAEISPSYFTSSHAIKNIKSNFPDAKIVITLRHPLKRAMSALSHIRRIGFLPQTWEDEAQQDSKHVKNILDASSYQHYVQLWSDTFPGNVCIIRQITNGKYDNIDIEKVGEFIGVDIKSGVFSGTRANSALETRLPILTNFIRKFKTRLITGGFFETIRVLKKLKPLLYRPQSTKVVDNAAEAYFTNKLSEEIAYFESLSSFSIK